MLRNLRERSTATGAPKNRTSLFQRHSKIVSYLPTKTLSSELVPIFFPSLFLFPFLFLFLFSPTFNKRTPDIHYLILNKLLLSRSLQCLFCRDKHDHVQERARREEITRSKAGKPAPSTAPTYRSARIPRSDRHVQWGRPHSHLARSRAPG